MMETHVSIKFKNYTLYKNESTIPIQMEIFYESKKLKFSYPLAEPLIINFSKNLL